MIDLTSPDEVKALMLSSKSEQEWDDNRDTVKRANKGYPEFWYELIILGGVLHEAQIGW